MHLVIDENISFAKELFSRFGTVSLLPGRAITRTELLHCDVLIVRSVTRVDEQLLSGTQVRFVGTATIGTDHVDAGYLEQQGIQFADAKGCNADAVTEYIITAVFQFLAERNLQPEGMSFGIIGCGNIGGRLAGILPKLGFTVLRNDPPLERAGGKGFVSFQEILHCDIISCHTPLNRNGQDSTYHLLDTEQIVQAANLRLLLNASRGEVVSPGALRYLQQKTNAGTVLDVWEPEPQIPADIAAHSSFASPHVAGYTYEGKVNGSVMMYKALKTFLGREDLPEGKELIAGSIEAVTGNTITVRECKDTAKVFAGVCNTIYNIRRDTERLQRAATLSAEDRGELFDRMRKEYLLRREFSNYTLLLQGCPASIAEAFRAMRFTVIEQ